MNGQEYQFIGNRKKDPIDDDGPVSKKHSRNRAKKLNKTVAQTKMIEEVIQKKKQMASREQKNTPVDNNSSGKLTDKQIKKINDIKQTLINHRRQTIQRVLQKHNYDKLQALQQLFEIPEDEVQGETAYHPASNGKKSQNGNNHKNSQKQHIANEILNEIYDNAEQIDPFQFEQLFAEITTIIQEEEKNQGMAIFEINKFIDDCHTTIKQVVLEGKQEIYVDENDELYRQTEQFLMEIIKKNVAFEAKRKQQFPSLEIVAKQKPSEKGYIQKIQDSYKAQMMKQQYFVASKVPQIYRTNDNKHQYSLYAVNNDAKSYEDILQLSKQYSDMGIDNLKLIYLRLDDINLCKKFLDRYYPGKKKTITYEKTEKKKVISTVRAQQVQPKYKRLQDANYKNYSLQEIRDELDHLFKVRSMFRMTRGKTTNIAYRKQLQRLANRDDDRIRKLSQVARFKAIEQMASKHPLYIDLHGYRAQQIDELFEDIIQMIKLLMRSGSSKLQTTKTAGSSYCILKTMTGKGLHSKYNKSVLKPAVLQWCDQNGYKAVEGEDCINIYIQLV